MRVRTKRRTILITVLVCIAGAIALLAFRSRDNEPRYNGKPLSYWLALYERHRQPPTSPEYENAFDAVSAIGTNALPYLVEWINYELPPWRRELFLKLPVRLVANDTFKRCLAGDYVRAQYALYGFEILGTRATSTIPVLEAWMTNKSAPGRSLSAVLALGNLGPAAVPALSNALADPQQYARSTIVHALGKVAHGADTNVVLPTLVTTLTDH